MQSKTAILSMALAWLTGTAANAQLPSPSRVLGGWYTGDPLTEASAVLVFFETGEYLHITGAHQLNAPSRRDGYERGTYTFDAATGAFSVVTTRDANGDHGLSGLNGVPGATAELAGDTLTFAIPGQSQVTFNRVPGLNGLSGAWVDGASSIGTFAIVFLPNQIFYFYEDIDWDIAGSGPQVGHGRYGLEGPDLAFIGDPVVWLVDASSDGPYWMLGNDISVRITRISRFLLTPMPTDSTIALEFHHAGSGHYFVTASAAEMAMLVGGAFVGWARTGQSFKVYSLHEPGTSPVCRFVSNTARVSHFHTAFADECAAVRSDPYWTFEGEVFGIRLPDAGGGCVAGTVPLYRLYNNGRSGAPNHRLTTNPVTRGSLLAQGYVAEGLGPAGVAGCVPQ